MANAAPLAREPTASPGIDGQLQTLSAALTRLAADPAFPSAGQLVRDVRQLQKFSTLGEFMLTKLSALQHQLPRDCVQIQQIGQVAASLAPSAALLTAVIEQEVSNLQAQIGPAAPKVQQLLSQTVAIGKQLASSPNADSGSRLTAYSAAAQGIQLNLAAAQTTLVTVPVRLNRLTRGGGSLNRVQLTAIALCTPHVKKAGGPGTAAAANAVKGPANQPSKAKKSSGRRSLSAAAFTPGGTKKPATGGSTPPTPRTTPAPPTTPASPTLVPSVSTPPVVTPLPTLPPPVPDVTVTGSPAGTDPPPAIDPSPAPADASGGQTP